MSQDEIIKTLKEKKEPLTSKELAEYIGIRQETIIKALKKLIKSRDIKCRRLTKEDKEDKGHMPNMNNRMRVFWVDGK